MQLHSATKILKLFFVCLLTFSGFLSAQNEELFVRLATENQLMGITVSFQADSSGFSKDYAKQLETIARYDFNHNGSTQVELQKQTPLKVKFSIHQQAVSLYLEAPGLQKKFDAIPLSGNLSEDRKIIHKLADAAYHTLFEKQGIAGSRILFTLKMKDFKSEVYEADFDGGNVRKVTDNAGYAVTPSFVPPKPGYASGSFLYVGYQTGQPKIYLCPLKGGRGQRLISLAGNQLMPTISRQRDQIAFVSDVTGNPDLFLMPFDPETGVLAKPRKIFTAQGASQGTPTFSPDGKKIAFVTNKDGSPRIWIMNVPSAGTPLKEMFPALLTKSMRECTAPAWSPDGTKIAFCSKSDGARQIWIHDLTTGEQTQLTKGPLNKENPSWAPNGLCLIYNTTDLNQSDLYVVNIRGGNPEKLSLAVSGEKHFPSWEIYLR